MRQQHLRLEKLSGVVSKLVHHGRALPPSAAMQAMAHLTQPPALPARFSAPQCYGEELSQYRNFLLACDLHLAEFLNLSPCG